MALDIGNVAATSGMTKAIYDEISGQMEPIEGLTGADLESVRDGWRKLAYAISHGVVTHITANMEVHEVVTRGDVEVDLSTGQQNNVAFEQDETEPGSVR